MVEFYALFFIIIISAVSLWLYQALKPQRRPIPENVFKWPDLDEYDFEVVGESHYQSAIKVLAGQDNEFVDSEEYKAFLTPENNNPYDNKAVRVDIEGMTVGYLSREDARSFRRRLKLFKLCDQITQCKAVIVGGGVRDGERWKYGVYLNIKPFNRFY